MRILWLSSTLFLILLLVLFSSLITVSSKLFLQQIVILTFCASSSPLQPATGEEGQEGSEGTACGFEYFSGNANTGNTIPKPQPLVFSVFFCPRKNAHSACWYPLYQACGLQQLWDSAVAEGL